MTKMSEEAVRGLNVTIAGGVVRVTDSWDTWMGWNRIEVQS